jgi:hypothetical protein
MSNYRQSHEVWRFDLHVLSRWKETRNPVITAKGVFRYFVQRSECGYGLDGWKLARTEER